MLTFNAKDLADTLAKVSLAAEKRASVVVLSNVRIVAENGMAYFTCSNLDMTITAKLPADMAPDTKFGTIVPVHPLLKAVKLAKTARVSMWLNGNGLSLEYQGCRLAFPVLPVEDFPTKDSTEHKLPPTKLTLPGATLRELFDSVALAISTEETRYYLNGIFWHIRDNQMRTVTTDGHRLGMQAIDIPSGAADMPGVIIPRETVHALLKLWKGKSVPETVMVCTSENATHFKWPGHCLQSKTIDGTFPEYTQVMPKPSRFASVAIGPLCASLKSLTATCDKYSKFAVFEFWHDSLILRHGENSTKLECTFDGADPDGFTFTIGFNANYICEIAQAAGSESDTLRIGFPIDHKGDLDNGSPVHIAGSRAAEYVLMPMRV
jgi:DNA polymerase-3 subunit beta